MIEALIFDFDGLILDTERPGFVSWQEIWKEHGVDLGIDDWAVCIGTSGNFDVYEELEKALGRPVDRQDIRNKRHQRYNELLLAEAISPGILSYLKDAESLDLQVGIASSSSRGWVQEQLSRLDLAGRFNAIFCRDDAGVPKPDPAVYKLALNGLGVSAHHTIAFEDSPNGIAAANSAGVFCVAVPCTLTAALDLSQADLHLRSLEEMSLSELISHVVSANESAR